MDWALLVGAALIIVTAAVVARRRWLVRRRRDRAVVVRSALARARAKQRSLQGKRPPQEPGA